MEEGSAVGSRPGSARYIRLIGAGSGDDDATGKIRVFSGFTCRGLPVSYRGQGVTGHIPIFAGQSIFRCLYYGVSFPGFMVIFDRIDAVNRWVFHAQLV